MADYTNSRTNSLPDPASPGFRDGDTISLQNGSRFSRQNGRWEPIAFQSDSAESPLTVRNSAQGIALAGAVTYPPDFRWGYSYRPTLFDNGATIAHDVDSIATADPACYTGPIYHVDSKNGSDSNTGLGTYPGDFAASPLKSAKKAQDLLNATGAAGQIWIKYYADSASLRTASSVITAPTVPTLIRGIGGKAKLRVADSYTFAQVSGSTTYKLAGTTISRVFDLLNRDADGNCIELVKTTGTADAALATAGTWATT